VVVFGPLDAGWLTRRRHRSRTARRLAGDHRPGATPGRRHPSEVVPPVLAADRSGAAAPPPGGDRPGGPRRAVTAGRPAVAVRAARDVHARCTRRRRRYEHGEASPAGRRAGAPAVVMTDLLAWTGAALSGVLCVPQAVRAWRADRLAGVSAATYWLTLANAVVWLGWAVCAGQPAVGAPAAVTGPASALVLWRLRRADRPARASPQAGEEVVLR
jgi:hypothetical protein